MNKPTHLLKVLGSSHHAKHDRQKEDYYATDPECAEDLMRLEKFEGDIWEPACGEGHLSKTLEKEYKVYSSDLIDRGFGIGNLDFLKTNPKEIESINIVTNPPYSHAQEFVEHSMKFVKSPHKVVMFLKLLFLEGNKRKKMFEKYPPKTVYVYSSRRVCAMNGDFFRGNNKKMTGAVCYAWFVWEAGYKGDTIIKWI